MAQTEALLRERLPECMASICLEYFGKSDSTYVMARLGQWEDCHKSWADADTITRIIRGATFGRYLDIIESAIARRWRSTFYALSEACKSRYVDSCKLCMNVAINMKRTVVWWTEITACLSLACYSGYIDIARIILNCVGFGVEILNAKVWLACLRKKPEIVVLLGEYGATVCGYCKCHPLNHRPMDEWTAS